MQTAKHTLDGQWVLITGAGKRIGACIARTLHAAGANVAVHYRASADSANEIAAELNAERADSALTVQGDLLDVGRLAEIVAHVVEQTGRLDILVNNASSFYPTPLGEITPEHWEDLMGTNLKAPLFLSQAAAPHLRQRQGSIVNIVDIHAHAAAAPPHRVRPGQSRTGHADPHAGPGPRPRGAGQRRVAGRDSVAGGRRIRQLSAKRR